MKSVLNKYKLFIACFIIFLVALFPIRSFAHDSYFLQVLIDDSKYQYMGSVISENITLEKNHIEKKVGKFSGIDVKVNPYKTGEDKAKAYTDYESDKDLKDDTMIFTFKPKEVKKWYGAASNHASGKDADKAYLIQQNLMNGLNDALRVVNKGKPFESTEALMKKGNELARAINGSGSIDGFTVTKGRAYSGSMPKGVTADDYITITNKTTKEKYEFVYRMKKGYKTDDNYKNDTEYVTWHILMYQANYSYAVHGYTVKNGQELAKPNALEEMIVELLENLFNQLRNLLGLYDINELVFNDGIRGSSAYTHGIMSDDWSEKALFYHWIFQAFAWSIIIFSIAKALLQRNLATINPAMRVSLIQSVQDLLITGLFLASAIPIMNMLMFLNFKIVDVFGATAPDFADLSGINDYSGMLGGVLMQFFYFGISIYLNFVYIMRAITMAILIATAPMFIVTISLGGKWKQLFWTWIKEFNGNLFLQAFHAFTLSFFFAITTSSRGIESVIVMMALIPLTEFFRTMVLGSGGGISHSLGMQSIQQGAGMVNGALSKAKSKPNGSSGGGSSSSRETSSANSDSNIGNFAGNSDKIKNNSENMTQRQRMNSSKESMGTREMSLNKSENIGSSSNSLDSKQSFGQKVRNGVENIQEKGSQAKDALSNNAVTKVTNGVAKTAVGATKAVVGTGMALSMGMANPTLAKQGMDIASSGVRQMTGGMNDSFNSVKDTLPEDKSDYATTLPNGDIQMHRNAEKMAKLGVVGASMEGTKSAPIAKYTYDTSKLGSENQKNLLGAYSAFKTGNQDAINYYKSQGIENMTRNANNNLVVRYNKTGMEKMGIKSVDTIGKNGANARIVETKSVSAPNTLRTLPIQRYEDVVSEQKKAQKQALSSEMMEKFSQPQQNNN